MDKKTPQRDTTEKPHITAEGILNELSSAVVPQPPSLDKGLAFNSSVVRITHGKG